MQDFAVIPVLDLKDGFVVHARAGKRAEYRPLVSPHGPTDDPLALARALHTITGSPFLYVADLDAIAGTGNHFELCRALANALPSTTLWIDAGFSDVTDCAFWLPLGATLVIGSESVATAEAWAEIKGAFGPSVVLSLDFDDEGLRGPEALASDPALWPGRVIVMSLGRVGMETGPDLGSLKAAIQAAGNRAVFAAGGIRNIADLEAAAAAGAAGALLATALHSGAVTQNEIAALLGERRSV